MKSPRPTKVQYLAINPKHLLYFVCDIVAIVQPTTFEIIHDLIIRIVDDVSKQRLEAVVGLSSAMALLQRVQLSEGDQVTTYYVTPEGGRARPYHHRILADPKTQRASHVSVLFAIPEALRVFRQIYGT
ncbi:MAG: hypothetical protein ABIP75_02390 [Pyrinomonadaceae bacterium]